MRVFVPQSSKPNQKQDAIEPGKNNPGQRSDTRNPDLAGHTEISHEKLLFLGFNYHFQSKVVLTNEMKPIGSEYYRYRLIEIKKHNYKIEKKNMINHTATLLKRWLPLM